ncbi:hypothetical protein LTR85_000910 [Meristemomyces frigidus]|nr:hypothetical protein LTR85_000910 [Meristemomyces frigidus]
MATFLTFFALLALGAASNTTDTHAVCNYLYNKYPKFLAWDTTGPDALETAYNASVYTEINTVYWNSQNSQYRAACAFFPATAEQVSDAVHMLNNYTSVPYALKSGGHQPAPGFSSTDGGVMISFEPNLNQTVRAADGKHFVVGAGARWGNVYKVAEETNQVVVGGRLGHIGVGGFVLGGGLSYYSAQYGFACDNVDNFEVVLANGTIANANRTSNPDLWFALRGGGNQFAIVTRMWLQAHPLGDNGLVWGGTRSYSTDNRVALFKAITNFVRTYPDKKAAVIPTFQFGLPANLLNAVTGPLFFFFYDGETPPAGVFDEFDAIPSIADNTGTNSYYNISMVDGGASMSGFGNSFRMNTLPNMAEANMTSFFGEYFNQTFAQSLKDSLSGLDVQIMGFDPQPVPVAVQQASQDQGGNALGFDPANGDRIFFENNLLWVSQSCDTKCPEYSRQVSDSLLRYHKEHYAGVPPTNYQSGDISVISYNPLFMNDAAPYQDPYTSYGPTNLAKLQAAKQKYDPTGFFTTRQGGFKLPA